MSVSIRANTRSMRQDKGRAAKVRQHLGGSDLRSDASRREAGVSIFPHRSDENPTPREALFDAAPTIRPAEGRHWFVNSTDYPGYCAACGLPARNRRHARRTAAS